MEPAAAVRGRALGAVDDAGGFASELLPDGVDQERGAVSHHDAAITAAVGTGDQVERRTGQPFGDAAGDQIAVFAGVPQVRDGAKGADLAVPSLDRLGREQVGRGWLARLGLPGDGHGQETVEACQPDDLIVAAICQDPVQAGLAMESPGLRFRGAPI